MIKKWFLTLLACLSIAAVLVAYKVMDNRAAEQANAGAPEYSETVDDAIVESIHYQPAVSVLGQVIAPQQVALRNEVASIVTDVNFESGTAVKKGQLLIQLDVSEERAQLQSAVARAELARTTKKRMAKLRDSRTVSQDQYDKAVAELKVAAADKAMIEASIAKKTIRAPFDAIAGLHQFERGQYLEENTLITTLVGLQSFVWVDFSLPQVYGGLPADARVSIEPLFNRNSSSSRSMDWSSVSAKVIARESIMTRESRSLHYRAQLDKGKADLLPNAIVNVKAPIAQPQSKLAIPAIAVLHSSTGPYVYILDVDSQASSETAGPSAYRARRQPVTLGESQGDLMIIDSGLELGQRVASAGAFKLSDGLLSYVAEPIVQSDSSVEKEKLEANDSQEAL
ncbi:MAG: efflux RND transporter periplasmic adaptor subunit [Pseudomonadales bacterium]